MLSVMFAWWGHVRRTMDIVLEEQELFDIVERVGSGAFGVVYRGTQRSDQQTVAIKVIDLDYCEDEIEEIHKEIHVLQQCKCSQLTR